MPFGKYKNKPINEIDSTYLEWVLANCQQISPDLKQAICTKLGLEVKDDPEDRRSRNSSRLSRNFATRSWYPGWRLMIRGIKMGRTRASITRSRNGIEP